MLNRRQHLIGLLDQLRLRADDFQDLLADDCVLHFDSLMAFNLTFLAGVFDFYQRALATHRAAFGIFFLAQNLKRNGLHPL